MLSINLPRQNAYLGNVPATRGSWSRYVSTILDAERQTAHIILQSINAAQEHNSESGLGTDRGSDSEPQEFMTVVFSCEPFSMFLNSELFGPCLFQRCLQQMKAGNTMGKPGEYQTS